MFSKIPYFWISSYKGLKEMQLFVLNCKIFTCCPYTFRVGEPLSLWSLILLQKFSRWKVFILPFFNSLWGSISEKQGLHSGNFFYFRLSLASAVIYLQEDNGTDKFGKRSSSSKSQKKGFSPISLVQSMKKT